MKTPFRTRVMVTAIACLAVIQSNAEKLPLSLSELQKSDLIVVGTISQIRVESEPARGHGNRDWGIYVTLAVEQVEKGLLTDTEIEFRCFRVNYRRSVGEYLAPGGHRPIPGAGTRIRAYLNGSESNWAAALPNGITAPDANEDTAFWSSGHFPDAPEVAGLRSRRYTYFLPLELWGCILFVVTLVILVIILTRWYMKRRKRRRVK